MNSKTIAVHGATGSQGAPVHDLLSAAGHSVRPLSRATGADLLDRPSLEAAYAGADAVVLQLPLVYDERALRMGENVARAAEATGVGQLVINASCVLPPAPIGVPYVDARLLAAVAAVPRVTLLQPATTYLENLSAPWSGAREGVLAYPMPAAVPLRWVATRDVALAAERAIARAVAGSYVLPGIAATGAEVADAIAGVLGRPVRWETITPDAFGDMLRPHLGDHAADGTAALYRMLASSPPAPEPDPAPARAALGWAPRPIATWAAEAYRPLARAA